MALVGKVLDMGVEPLDIWNTSLAHAISQIGTLFTRGMIYVPEVLVASRLVNQAFDMIRERQPDAETQYADVQILLAVVKGDLHDIGKNLVACMARAAGFPVIDLGVDVAPQTVVEAVRRHRPKIVGLSTLLTTTMSEVGEVTRALQEAGLRDDVKIVAGGAPLTQEQSAELGADRYAEDAAVGVEIFKEIAGAA